MHIPDGFLNLNVWGSTWLISAGWISYCLRKTSRVLKDRMVPLMGVISAFIFAAQMVNFPVVGGTSGHLLGGVLAGILLGPYVAAVVISVVLLVQCIIFQDGGLTALGANILNMAIVGTMGGYLICLAVRKISGKQSSLMPATAIASWFSVVLASISCSFELALSEVSPLNVVLPAMLSVHMLIGIGEAAITCFVIRLVVKVRPDLVYIK